MRRKAAQRAGAGRPERKGVARLQSDDAIRMLAVIEEGDDWERVKERLPHSATRAKVRAYFQEMIVCGAVTVDRPKRPGSARVKEVHAVAQQAARSRIAFDSAFIELLSIGKRDPDGAMVPWGIFEVLSGVADAARAKQESLEDVRRSLKGSERLNAEMLLLAAFRSGSSDPDTLRHAGILSRAEVDAALVSLRGVESELLVAKRDILLFRTPIFAQVVVKK